MAPAEDEQSFELDLASPFAAEGPMMKAAAEFAKEVEEATGGSIKINVFSDGALGTGNETWSAIASGDLDMAAIGQEGFDMYAEDFSFMISPFLFENMDHVKAVMNSEIGEALFDKYRESKVEPLALHWRDVRVTAADKEIKDASDVKDLKLRLPGIATYVDTWSELGAAPVTVAMNELYTALQTGVAEACEGGYEQMVTLKIYEVQDYIINTEHEFEQSYIVINSDLYAQMSENQQKILRELAQKWMTAADEESESSREAYKQECIDNGMTYIDFDSTPIIESLKEYYQGLFETKYTDYTYDEIMSYAK